VHITLCKIRPPESPLDHDSLTSNYSSHQAEEELTINLLGLALGSIFSMQFQTFIAKSYIWDRNLI